MMAENPDDYSPEWVAILARGPMRVTEYTSEEELATEMAERLDALFRSHNGLEPNAEGWRQLALELALKYEPLFSIDTPDDRKNLGGRPVGIGNFSLRSQMKAEMRKGKSQAEAARAVSKASKGNISAKTANNVMSGNAQAPDLMRRWPHEWKAARAMQMAAHKLSQD